MPGTSLVATLFTLYSIAALTERPAARLKPADSLVGDLAFIDAKFAVFALWQRQDGDRLRSDGKKTRITKPQAIEADTVRGEVALLLDRLGIAATDGEVDALIAQAQGLLS